MTGHGRGGAGASSGRCKKTAHDARKLAKWCGLCAAAGLPRVERAVVLSAQFAVLILRLGIIF